MAGRVTWSGAQATLTGGAGQHQFRATMKVTNIENPFAPNDLGLWSITWPQDPGTTVSLLPIDTGNLGFVEGAEVEVAYNVQIDRISPNFQADIITPRPQGGDSVAKASAGSLSISGGQFTVSAVRARQAARGGAYASLMRG